MKPLATKPRGMDQIADASFNFCCQGNILDIVLQVQEASASSCKGITSWHGELFVCDWHLEPGIWTMYGAVFESFASGIGFLSRWPDTSMVRKPSFTPACLRTLRETCGGMGGISIGASFLGFQAVVFNDRSELTTDLLSLVTLRIAKSCNSCILRIPGSLVSWQLAYPVSLIRLRVRD